MLGGHLAWHGFTRIIDTFIDFVLLFKNLWCLERSNCSYQLVKKRAPQRCCCAHFVMFPYIMVFLCFAMKTYYINEHWLPGLG